MTVDMAGHILEFNPAFQAMTGYTGEELSRLTYQELTPERWRAFEARIVAEQVIPKGHSEVYQKEYRRPDGTIFPIELRTYLLRNERNQPIGMWAIVRDITERERAERELRISREKFERIFECSPVSMTVSDLNDRDRFLEVNEAFERFTGHSRAGVIGKTYPPDWLWPDAQEYAQAVSQFTENGKLSNVEFHFRRKSGEIRTGLLSAENIEVGGHACVLATTIDITERKQAEAALRESTRQLLAVANCVPDLIWFMDLSGSFNYVSPSVERTHGWTAEEALKLTRWDVVSPEQAVRDDLLLREELKKAASPDYDRGRIIAFESEQLRKDGTTFWAEVRASLVWSEDGRAVGAIGTTRDITERRRAEEDRERLRQQLAQSQKLECVGRLAGGIAHDFNNLISAIVLNADSAVDELKSGASPADSVNAIRDAAEKAIAVGRQLMAFSSGQALQTEWLDINSVVAENHKLVRRLIGEDIKVAFKPGSGLGSVNADRGQLGQILLNLAVNSRDAMPRGGSLTIETAAVEFDQADAELSPEAGAGSYVMLSVRDTGVGMDQETQTRIFEPFFTTKAVGKGTGLGLAVVYGIVRQSRGFITVASCPGEGTEFRIYLPAAAEKPGPIAETQTGPVRGGSETVLLVEDEPALRQRIRDVLHNAGYRVLVAADGDQALLLALQQTGPIHLLLTDVVMPQMTGPRLSERLLALRPGTKVLYMSGYPRAGDARVELPALFDLVQKPFTKEQLLRRVREALDRPVLPAS